MGGHLNTVVASPCMEKIEETAIDSTLVLPKVCKSYEDDSFCIIKKDAVTSFHNSLNSIDLHISFTMKHESNSQFSFLITLVSRDLGKLDQ